MSELTKCWLRQAITGIETIRDDMPFGLDEDEQKTLASLKMALSVLDAQENSTIRKRKALLWLERQQAAHPGMNEVRYAIELLTVPPAATVPDGWKMVPIEPNWSMLNAAINFHEGEAFLPASLYKAMLAAAPAPGGNGG